MWILERITMQGPGKQKTNLFDLNILGQVNSDLIYLVGNPAYSSKI